MIFHKDIVILGGGIAGLWLLQRLLHAGYDAVLFEADALGHGQTIASQGMIHGGLKYALGGTLTGASEAIAEMPAYWQRCLRGEGEVDLRGAGLLSDAYYLWPSDDLRSRLTAFLGSKMVSSKVNAVSAEDYPCFFRNRIHGPLYRLHDIVLDVPSLLQHLGERSRGRVFHLPNLDTSLERAADGGIAALHLPDGSRVQAKRFIFTAGEGNEGLARHLSHGQVRMQRRPLQMVIVKHHLSDPLYVHCVGADFSATPALTITTHRCADGRSAWYLGGELAESGASLDTPALLQRARELITRLFPWCDFSTAELQGFRVDRAEASQPDGKRPDRDSVLSAGNALYCWPTKLTLAPALATNVLSQLQLQGITPGPVGEPLSNLPHPRVAMPPWER